MNKAISTAILLALFNFETAIAGGLPNGFISVSQMHIGNDRLSHGFEWYLKSRDEETIRKSIAKYQNTAPRFIRLDLESKPRVKRNKEETYYDLRIPNGYVFCAVRIGVRSLYPETGEKAPIIKAMLSGRHLKIYTWTPGYYFWEDKSWVDADVQLIGIWESFQSSAECRTPEPLECKGSPCLGMEYGGINRYGYPLLGKIPKNLNEGF